MIWIFFGATMCVGFFIVEGGRRFVAESILGTGLVPYGILLQHARHVRAGACESAEAACQNRATISSLRLT